MASNPLGIFSAALANGPHTEPVDVGQILNRNRLAQAQAGNLEQDTQAIALKNRREAIEQKADQAMRDAIKANTKPVPVGPPPSNFPPPPNMGTDASGNPLPPPPEYKNAQAAAAVNAPKTDWYGVAAQLASQGFGDRAMTLLKTHADLTQKELENAQKTLQNQQERNSAIGQRIGGLLQIAKPNGPQGAVDPAGAAQADQQWPALRRELIEQYGENPQNLPEHFGPWADPYFASKVGIDKANKAVLDRLEVPLKVAQTKQAEEQAKYLGSETAYKDVLTQQEKASQAAAEQFVKDPAAIMGPGGEIDKLTKPGTTLNDQFHKGAMSIWGGTGTFKQKQDEYKQLRQEIIKKTIETSPEQLEFDATKAKKMAKAQAEGQSEVLNNVGGAGGLDLMAEQALNGQFNSRDKILMSKVYARAAELAQQRGLSNQQVIMERNAAKANQGALDTLTKTSANVEAFAKVAQNNVKILNDQLNKVSDLGAPILNTPIRELQSKFGGNTNVAGFRAALMPVQAEIARILNSANAGGELTATARREMQHALGEGATAGQIRAALDVFNREINGRREIYKAQLADMKGQTVVGGPKPETDQPKATHRFNPTTGKIEVIQTNGR